MLARPRQPTGWLISIAAASAAPAARFTCDRWVQSGIDAAWPRSSTALDA